jgi:hypothetical protein
VLLISDGDDPSPDVDSEIEVGIQAARDAKIPVNVVGVGDPKNKVFVMWKRLDGEEELLGPTRLEEERLKEIARQTRAYLEARRDKPVLADFFRTQIEPRPTAN